MSVIDTALAMENTNEAVIAIDDYLFNRFLEDPDALTPEEKNVVYIENLEREINNGGFSQFFFNSSGDNAIETVSALKVIGASHTASLVQKAIDQFPDSMVPRDEDARQELIEEIEAKAEETWVALDQAFFEYKDDLTNLVLTYIKKNRPQFN